MDNLSERDLLREEIYSILQKPKNRYIIRCDNCKKNRAIADPSFFQHTQSIFRREVEHKAIHWDGSRLQSIVAETVDTKCSHCNVKWVGVILFPSLEVTILNGSEFVHGNRVIYTKGKIEGSLRNNTDDRHDVEIELEVLDSHIQKIGSVIARIPGLAAGKESSWVVEAKTIPENAEICKIVDVRPHIA